MSLCLCVSLFVIGAGGLGCEILKDLALSGFQDVHVIDMDTIDVSNLNRQFLFRHSDVGLYKAEVAAAFIMKRCPQCKVTPYTCKIQEKSDAFYKKFSVIVAGLDNVEARQYINSVLCGFVEEDEDGDVDPETVIPLIDGGTSAFQGQARVIIPRVTACFHCAISTLTKTKTVQVCTVATNPRTPAHCVIFEKFSVERKIDSAEAREELKLWVSTFGKDTPIDNDSPAHMRWIWERAGARAKRHNIPSPTYMQTVGWVKNIVPAIASTNALIAASCCNEAWKLVTFASQTMNNWHQYMGGTGVATYTYAYARDASCKVCQRVTLKVKTSRSMTLQQLRSLLESEHGIVDSSLRTSEKNLYMSTPPVLEKATCANLSLTLSQLGLGEQDEIAVTGVARDDDSDSSVRVSCTILVSFS